MKIFIKSFFYLILGFILFVVLSFAWGLSFGRLIVGEQHINIVNTKIPANFNNTKISVVNDIYLNNSDESKQLLKDTVNKVNDTNPTYFVLNGGLLDPRDIKAININEKQIVEQLLNINAKYGKFVTFSKQECQNKQLYDELKSIYLKSGFIILDNINYNVIYNDENKHINFLNYDKLNKNDLKVNSKNFTFAFSNNPESVLRLKNSGVEYFMHGNTLGGLINMPYAKEIFPAIKNLKSPLTQTQYNKTQVIENTGIGTTILPIRVWNEPKVFVLHLLNKE